MAYVKKGMQFNAGGRIAQPLLSFYTNCKAATVERAGEVKGFFRGGLLKAATQKTLTSLKMSLFIISCYRHHN